MQNKYLRFVVSIIIPQLAGIIGSVFTSSKIPTWYTTLEKSSLNPPGWVFGPVWITLYFLIGVSLYIVWSKSLQGVEVKSAIKIFAVQLILNSLWSIAFFGLENPLLALGVIVLLWVMIIWNIFSFSKISKRAAWLLVPYLLWVSFASYLNYSIWALN